MLTTKATRKGVLGSKKTVALVTFLALIFLLLPALHSSAASPGTVWAWGDNWYGELGDGTNTNRWTPVQVSGLSGVVAMSGGGNHTLVLKSDGTVWAWGRNSYGQLGDGTTTQRNTPVQVSGLSGVVAVEGGGFHSLALKSDGTVWAWGYNYFGQLGDGTTTDRWTPVQVSGLSGAVAVAGGHMHSLALNSDGTVWAWGHNRYGELGDGTATDRLTPVQVSGLSGVVAVAGGYYHILALKSDGTVWAWGGNWYGELGDGTTTERWTPVQVSGLSGVAVEGGGYHSLALKSDGTVWAWGRNSYGQLGDGTTTQRNTPVQVSGLSGVVAVEGGGYHSLALKSDGTVWAWGNNLTGQLGDGTTTDRWTPVQVSGLTGAVAVAGGGYHNLALKCTSPTVTSISPTSGNQGAAVTVNGTAFGSTQGSSYVSFGSVQATQYNQWSDAQITALVPANTSGVVPVTVTTSGGTSNATNFSVIPSISSLSPTGGSAGTTVTINGTAFSAAQGSSNVYFGTVAATSYTSWSDTQITAIVPAGLSGVVPVTVTTSGGTSNATNFTVTTGPTPTVTSISPTFGKQGAVVTVKGTAFRGTRGSSKVYFGTVAATSYISWSDRSITARVPANTSGVVPVTVTTPGGTSNAVNFRVVPHISSISPRSGSAGTTVTINGTAFGSTQGSSKVYFGTVRATSYTSWSDTKINVTVPAGLSRVVPVTVSTPGGKSNAVIFGALPGGGEEGMPYWVSAHDYTAPIYYKARGANVCNYIMQEPMSVHVNSVYVDENNNWDLATWNFEELGWVWDDNMKINNIRATDPYYFWAVRIKGNYYGGYAGLIRPAPKGEDTQLQIYMANPTDTPWPGGYMWNYLINNELVAQFEGANSCGCAHVASERDFSGPSNYAHFWHMYSMGSRLGSWQIWRHMRKYYQIYWDPEYTWRKKSEHEVYFIEKRGERGGGGEM